MSDKTVTLQRVYPVHPGRGEQSYVAAGVVLDYLKGGPIATVRLTRAEAIQLIEQLAFSLRVTS